MRNRREELTQQCWPSGRIDQVAGLAGPAVELAETAGVQRSMLDESVVVAVRVLVAVVLLGAGHHLLHVHEACCLMRLELFGGGCWLRLKLICVGEM